MADLLTLFTAGAGTGGQSYGGQDNYGQDTTTGEQCGVRSSLLLKLLRQGPSESMGSPHTLHAAPG